MWEGDADSGWREETSVKKPTDDIRSDEKSWQQKKRAVGDDDQQIKRPRQDDNGEERPAPYKPEQELNVKEEAQSQEEGAGENFQRYNDQKVACFPDGLITPVDKFEDVVASKLLLDNIKSQKYSDMTPTQKCENDYDDHYDDFAYDDVQNNNGLDKAAQHDDDQVPDTPLDDDNPDENQEQFNLNDSNIWTLPAKREDCSLEEIRRGQVINNIAPNECPVIGCGKKINENRIEPSPGTIASGLRTHVLFVHYENRRANKKRKLGWSTKRKSQASPKKQPNQLLSPSTSCRDHELDLQFSNTSNLEMGLNLMKNSSSPQSYPRQQSSTVPGSIINKKVKQLAAKQSLQMSSLQSLMQATGSSTTGSSSPQITKQKLLDSGVSQPKGNLNPTTSSLFSILAGLTQQQQQQLNQQVPISKNFKTAQGTNTLNISQCPRNSTSNNNSSTTSNNHSNNIRPSVNSSLLSLLNEKISGNVASSLQSQLKKTLSVESRSKLPIPTSRQKIPSPANSYYQVNNDPNFNNSSSILSSLCSGNGDTLLPYDNSMPLNSFIESIAIKTGSHIGPSGVAEARKIIEKFTSSLICSSQTIADHYIAPFAGDVPQQKPEISPSDIMLAYKMMHKSHGQP